jgi:hypothetical protein
METNFKSLKSKSKRSSVKISKSLIFVGKSATAIDKYIQGEACDIWLEKLLKFRNQT